MVSYEPLKLEAITVAAINGVANLDTKAISAVEFAEHESCTALELGKAVMRHTGIIESKGFARQYASSYYSYGFASKETVDNSVNYVPKNISEALSVVGAFLAAAERHDESLIPYLSVSNAANSADHGMIAAPITNLKLLDGILKGIKPLDINIGEHGFNRGYPKPTLVHRRLQQLLHDKVIEVITDPNEFKINNPVYSGRVPWRDLKTETKAMYQVLSIADSLLPGQLWTVDKLTVLARQHQLIQDTEISQFRRSLYRAAGHDKAYPGAINKIEFRPPKYAVTQTSHAMASDLVQAAVQLSSGGAKLKRLNEDVAHDLYNDPVTAARIFRRGMRFSKKTKRYQEVA